MNTDLWEQYRTQIRHPSTVIKPEDLGIARRNIERHPWAREFYESYLRTADETPATTADYLESMIPPGYPQQCSLHHLPGL